jgi:NADH-quinone oxidoreductase subunit C
MNKEELKIRLEELLPSPVPVFEEGAEWTTVVIDPMAWEAFARELRSASGLEFDYLFCVTAIDWKTHFTMVYHLTSTVYRHTVVVKVK